MDMVKFAAEEFLTRVLLSPPFLNIPQVTDAILTDVLHLATKVRVRYQLD